MTFGTATGSIEQAAECSTLVELLRWRASQQPNRPAYTFLGDGEKEEGSLTYAGLDQRARAIGARLQAFAAPGERALLLYPPGLDYVAAFFGCLYAGLIAVPAYPPRVNRPMPRIHAILEDAQASTVLTTTPLLTDFEQRVAQHPELARLRCIATDGLDSGLEDGWAAPDLNAETLAFLQYTSGSTATPKGVMVSHGNLLHNEQMVQEAFGHDAHSTFVGWLPLYHDMGLIGNVLQPMFIGAHSILMSPLAFLQKPFCWLQAITRYQAHTSGGPNFGYELCARKITPEQREALDLRSWQVAFNGAEPIHAGTLERFVTAFAPHGFRRETFYPCYGLAEGTLFVTGGLKKEPPVLATLEPAALAQNQVAPAPPEAAARTLVGCGRVWLGQKIAIVDPETWLACPPDRVGEIWLSGASVAQGYWRRFKVSQETFRAYLADTGEGPFLRTGDLGFLKDGELFVTGRLKDLLIIRGRNHYPQDIELTVEQCHPALRPGCGAAFSVEVEGEERLVVVQEIERNARQADFTPVLQAIRQAVVEQHDVQVHNIVLIKTLSIHKTSSGKIQRQACKASFLARSLEAVAEWRAPVAALIPDTGSGLGSSLETEPGKFPPAVEIEAWLVARIARQLNLAPHAIDRRAPFASFGLDSLQGTTLAGELSDWLERPLQATLVWDYPSIEALAHHLALPRPEGDPVTTSQRTAPRSEPLTASPGVEPIALIGLGCRFPGANNPAEFWTLVSSGVDAIREVPANRWNAHEFYHPDPATPGKMNTRWGGFIDRIDQFDPFFFGISPREASRMDPQQRLLLEVAWEALEDAGQNPERLAGSRTGVFVGISTNDYSRLQFDDPASIDVYAGTGNAVSIAANRLSYVLDLHGPSLAIDTACSSSLMALHLACQSLRNGESRLALVGGVNVLLSPEVTIPFAQAGLLAPDGRCKTFDASANGYVRSEGCGMVVLKRLADAIRDGDPIRAVIRGSAVTQDGRSNGLMAPNRFSQTEAIQDALTAAGVSPAQVSYVEAHGTGTALGDPIEVDALKAAFVSDPASHQACALGSVKANIGHLESAAGIASLIKVVLALQHQTIPPQLHFKTLNSHISLEGSPFWIATASQPWRPVAGRRLSGVSSFGFGGTNVHVVLEEAPPVEAREPKESRPWQLLSLSAPTVSALETITDNLVDHLQTHPDQSLADIAYTSQTGRKAFGQRRVLVCRDVEDARRALASRDPQRVFTGSPSVRGRAVTFMLPGMGDHYVHMARDLYQGEPVFRAALDRCAEHLMPQLGLDIREVLYPPESEPGGAAGGQLDLRRMLGRDKTPAAETDPRLSRASLVHPALFAIEYALAQLWLSWGLQPQALIGYSIGEYAAACLAGVFSLEDGLTLVARRAQLIDSLPAGAMLAVPLSESELQPLLRDGLALAAVNGPGRCVVAGPVEAVAELERRLAERDLACRRVASTHAMHSPMMEPARAAFVELVKTVPLAAPKLPYVSNLTGTWITAAEATDPNYWAAHLCQPIRFSSGLKTLAADPERLLLEVGPGQTLCSLAWQYAENSEDARWLIVPSMRHHYDRQPDLPLLLTALGKLWMAGVPVDWRGFYAHETHRPVVLPTYPFEREAYWIESRPSRANGASAAHRPTPASPARPAPQDTDTLAQMQAIVASLLQTSPARVRVDTPFLEMGADSLVLVQAIRSIEKTFGVEVTVRQIFEELTTLQALAAYVDRHRLPAAPVGPLPEPAALPALAPAAGVEGLLAQQLSVLSEMAQVMSRQLQVLGHSGVSPVQAFNAALASGLNAAPSLGAAAARPAPPAPPPARAGSSAYVPYQPVRIEAGAESRSGLEPQQQQYLAAFVDRYTRRTPTSRQLTQHYRPILADNRASAGFRFSIKELLYPIVGERSQGSRLWDADGNAYVDISMGFGVNLFGHGAPFIQEAIEAQLRLGMQLGPQSRLAGEVAGLICELTGMERAAFCNSGTEAVMLAMRLARTATGRRKVALFAGSFHGEGDSTLAMAETVNGRLASTPMAPGIPPGSVSEMLVLDYGDPAALEILQAHASELAAVLVEPVQSRRPDFQPKAFLHQLRQLTRQAGIALIFDEMITGFRIHQGGAQAWYGVQADLATYGKIVGGGLPIGVVAGGAKYLDALDGGQWQYGDASYPQAVTTFWAGTFSKHPLAMAAARAVLQHLKAQGPGLQERLNRSTAALVETLNHFFEEERVPMRTVHCGSLFRFTFTQNLDLFFYHLLEKGVYLWEGRNAFLSTAHTQADVDYVIQAVKDSLREMRGGGFLPKGSPPDPHNDQPSGDDPHRPSLPIWPAAPTMPVWHGSRGETIPLNQAHPLPLTPMQQEIWLQSQMGPEASLAYHNPVVLRLRGQFDRDALGRAFEQVVERHEALRTVFSPDGDVQYVLPSLLTEVPLVDFSNLPEREAQADAWLRENSRLHFDLTRGPLARVHVLRLAADEHWLVLTTHQIVVDGISIGLLLNELSLLYQPQTDAECRGSRPILHSPGTPLPVGALRVGADAPRGQAAASRLTVAAPARFRDYVRWHADYMQSPKMADAEAYWLKRFAGPLPVLDLPTDHPRQPIETYTASRYSLKLDASLYARLKQLSARHHCTLFMTLLAGFQVLLYRLTGQTDVVVGTPTAGRPGFPLTPGTGVPGHDGPAGRPDLADQTLIGGCINLFAVSSRLAAGQAFSDYLAGLTHELVETYEHVDYPFGRLVRKLNPPRDPSRWPLVSVFFNLDRPLATPDFPGLSSEFLPHPISCANYDLNINILQLPDVLEIDCDYNVQLFAPETIQRWMRHFSTLLAALVEHPHQRLAELPLLTPDEVNRLLVDWNGSRRPMPAAVGIHHLFAQWAERTPDAVAVTWAPTLDAPDSVLTYAELDRRANRLAHWLQRSGVGLETPVAICAERSPDMIVGVLGVLKAGAAYLPLDPTYPDERLGRMLAEAGVSVILTQARLVDSLPAYSGKVLCLDADWDSLSDESPAPPPSRATAESLAYVIFTSGSTGRPKGVMVQHRSLVNAYGAWEAAYGLAEKVRCHLQMASFAFDVFAGDLVRALGSGGKLVLCPHDFLLSPAELHGLMVRAGIECAEFVPAVLRGLVQYLDEQGQSLDFVRVLVCGSDSWRVGEYQKFRQVLAGEGRLINSFGLTEATIDSSYFESSAPALTLDRLVPIGRPLDNMSLYLLSPVGQPVPVGSLGEIYVGGAGVARGYLGRPDLTAERFLPDPFSDEPGARLYRTGDLGRFLPDGNVEFVGRGDAQVKVRGFRVELGEIESVLTEHPGVRECAVVAQPAGGAPEHQRLVAYVVCAAGPVPGSVLQHFLKTKLPDYMIPSAVVLLEVLPLTPNGKVDVRALPAVSGEGLEAGRPFAAPRTPIEAMLVEIWSEILSLKRISVHSNFFELGGHSLLVTQVVSRVRDAFQVALPLRVLFEAPTVVELAAQIQRAMQAGEARPPELPMLPIRRDRRLALSSAQQRLWFIDQLEEGTGLYNISNTLHLEGTLVLPALAQSFAAIAQRHESLRTTFAVVDGRPSQVIAPVFTGSLTLVDLSARPEAERDPEARRIARDDAVRPFDLTQGPLVRLTLVRLAPQSHVLVLTLHHIIADGWSMGLLVHELAQHYAALSRGETAALPALPVQYADFAHWQHEWLQTSGALETQLDYWRQRLADAPAVLELPFDRPRPAVQTFRGATQTFVLPAAQVEALTALGRRSQATLFMTLLAAFQVLLSRYTAQDDLVIGTPIANRNRSEIEGLIGFFVNMLVLRTSLAGNPGFRELLGRVRETTLGAYAHQDLPFERLVSELQAERVLSYHPLFQVAFVLQNAPLAPLQLPHLTLTPWEMDYGTAKFDLMLMVEERRQGLTAVFEYNTDLFDHATVARLASHFKNLLDAILDDPDRPISDLALLSAAERTQLLTDWNATRAPYPREQCIHELFEAHAARIPDAVAAVYEDHHLTYGALNDRANRLAHYFQTLGVGPESLIGLCLERSLHLVVGVLGVWKAGAAYVPLDPAYPAERLAFMLAEVQAPVLLTQQRLAAKLPWHSALTVCLDIDWPAIAHAQPVTTIANPRVRVAPEHPAYVIYTSGSTGRPKGVLVPHQGLGNLLQAQQRAFDLTPANRVLQFSSISFDASAFEMVMAFGSGATLCLGAADSLLLGSALQEFLQGSAVDIVTLPPSALAALPEGALPALRTICVAGEACPASLVARWAPGRRFFNLYGPTEATIWTTTAACTDTERAPTIGYPIANTQVYVLDASLNPVPVGVPGELYIGGIGVTRGYLNRPDLTAERFIPNPFGSANGAGGGTRLYKTGDSVRYRPDGQIEFLGRVDHQVKVRGFRIELSEIEAVLNQKAEVNECAVLAQSIGGGAEHKRLVAYVVPAPGASLTVAQLHSYLKEKLPAYMLPAAFVFLESLPLTANGKLDRRALPAPGDARPELQEAYAAPRTPVEQQLAAIWSYVLGIARVGIHDNFFALGGDSILSIQSVARANQAGLKVMPKQMFQHQTIAQLAAVVEVGRPILAEQGLLEGAAPLTPVQQWFFEQRLPAPHHFNQSMLFSAAAPLDAVLLGRAVQVLLVHHDALRLRFEIADGRWRQVHAAPDDAPALTRVDLSSVPDEALARAIGLEADRLQASLTLGSGPLLRVGYFDLGPERPARLLVVIHHLVVDGVSWRVLLEDLQAAYYQLSQGESVRLLPKTTAFKQWGERLEAYARSPMLEAELSYWLDQPWTQARPLPVDFSPPGTAAEANTAASTAQVTVALGADETQALLREVPEVYRTQIHEVLLTALARTLSEWTDSTAVLVALEGHGREDMFDEVDVSRTVGWFTSLYPALVLLETDQPGGQLQSVKEQVRRIPNRGLGYGVLRYLAPSGAAALSALPQPQVSFNYLGQLDPVLDADALLRLADGPAGAELDPRTPRPYLLEISGQVSGGQLTLHWAFSRTRYRDATIERLAWKFMETLRGLIAHCLSPEAGGHSPSDFPLANVDPSQLNQALSMFDL